MFTKQEYDEAKEKLASLSGACLSVVSTVLVGVVHDKPPQFRAELLIAVSRTMLSSAIAVTAALQKRDEPGRSATEAEIEAEVNKSQSEISIGLQEFIAKYIATNPDELRAARLYEEID